MGVMGVLPSRLWGHICPRVEEITFQKDGIPYLFPAGGDGTSMPLIIAHISARNRKKSPSGYKNVLTTASTVLSILPLLAVRRHVHCTSHACHSSRPHPPHSPHLPCLPYLLFLLFSQVMAVVGGWAVFSHRDVARGAKKIYRGSPNIYRRFDRCYKQALIY